MADPYLGQIILFAGNFAPEGWALCNGQTLPINQNTALYSLLGTTYGGDGRSTFAVPNLQGRVVVGGGRLSGGSDYSIGTTGGSEGVTLATAQMPAHNHSVNVDASIGTQGNPTGANIAEMPGDNRDGTMNAYTTGAPSSPAALSNNTIASQGGNQSHENRQPYMVINYIIALQGMYPQRP